MGFRTVATRDTAERRRIAAAVSRHAGDRDLAFCARPEPSPERACYGGDAGSVNTARLTRTWFYTARTRGVGEWIGTPGDRGEMNASTFSLSPSGNGWNPNKRCHRGRYGPQRQAFGRDPPEGAGCAVRTEVELASRAPWHPSRRRRAKWRRDASPGPTHAQKLQRKGLT
jgi:hypothetical protein